MQASQGVVLITGCGSGIGQALAVAFHARGHIVCATARRLETMAELAAAGIMTRVLDVNDIAQAERLIHQLHEEGFYVDTLVNNAGYGAMGPMLDVPDDVWRQQFNVNLFAPMTLMRLTVPAMRARQRGTLINISSVSGVLTTPFAGPYCASKAAFNAASDALRLELKPFGIRVITVQPGGIRSAFGSHAAHQVSLADDSPYQAIATAVLARAQESQSDAMPADVFARELVRRITPWRCPPILRLGRRSKVLPFIKTFLPTSWSDALLRRKFKLDHLTGR